MQRSVQRAGQPAAAWIPETRFGVWFQGTSIWGRYVLEPALHELFELLPAGPRPRRVLDLGCGEGAALPELRRRFDPELLEAVDVDPAMVHRARARAAAVGARVSQGDASRLELPSDAFDLVLCHQTLHHVSDQEAALAELFRVLAPGGFLLLSESCRRFVAKIWVRLFFRHPPSARRSPEAYLGMLHAAGFRVDPGRIRHPAPAWAGEPKRRGTSFEPGQLLLLAVRPVGGLGASRERLVARAPGAR